MQIKPQYLGYYEEKTPEQYYFSVCCDLCTYGSETSPRNLRTLELHPTFALIAQPRKRIITSIGRVVNLPFALAEVVQILTGQNDAQALKYYNSKIMEFQGDNPDATSFNAAYGERLRHFEEGHYVVGTDQLQHIIETLKRDPDSRQATAVISHPYWDNYQRVTKDRACNLVSHAMVRQGRLDWMQVMRSNDIIFGLPYNLIQWCHVQEYVATQLGVPIGNYTLVQDSLHCYEHQFEELKAVAAFDMYDYFEENEYFPMLEDVSNVAHWERKIRQFGPQNLPRDNKPEYWREVIEVFNAYACYQRKQDYKAFQYMPHTFELRWPLMRWMVYTRWSKKEEYEHLVNMVVSDLSENGFPRPKIYEWLGIAK